MLKAAAIVNPKSGGGRTGRAWPRVEAMLSDLGVKIDSCYTEYAWHAPKLALQASKKDYDLIIAVGGDGTINEVVNGILQAKNEGVTPPPLAVIPAGTGSDFAKALKIPVDLKEAAKVAIEGETKTIDAGKVTYMKNGESAVRFFNNVAGVGLDADVVRKVGKYSKLFRGTTPFVLALFETYITYKNPQLTLKLDSEEITGEMVAVAIANGQYYGGGMWVAPNAKLDDQKFDIIIIGKLGKLETLTSLKKIYTGEHLTHPKITQKRTDKIEIVAQEKQAGIEVDGEYIGKTPATFQILPKALKVKTLGEI